MSRIGRKPIDIPDGIKIEQKGLNIKVSGLLGTAEMNCHPAIKVRVDNKAGIILVENDSPEVRRNKQLHGTMRNLIANMVTGVTKGFEKKMEIYGTGYSVKQSGEKLILQVGFSHPIEVPVPKNIKVNIKTEATRGNDTPATFTISSTDKALLGQFAANIRSIRPPEPYKGKGIRYADEHVRRKAGKALVSGTP